jgi:hypothetical protein
MTKDKIETLTFFSEETKEQFGDLFDEITDFVKPLIIETVSDSDVRLKITQSVTNYIMGVGDGDGLKDRFYELAVDFYNKEPIKTATAIFCFIKAQKICYESFQLKQEEIIDKNVNLNITLFILMNELSTYYSCKDMWLFYLEYLLKEDPNRHLFYKS